MGTEQGPTSIDLLDIWVSLFSLPFSQLLYVSWILVGCILYFGKPVGGRRRLIFVTFLKNGIVYLIFLGTFTS